ncbi:DUF4249 domain-containing protein [uncultured Roseivirga sp.]|uniref:DUF4249 domain-containing protein n=1 Tax=uncultured Roseivirga sp. TaxID=543088 RepID=UPI0030DB3C65|tara:strand:- start:216737 stop:217582 length:846 start_codon:yes stop_codon:yes gene_type:complete
MKNLYKYILFTLSMFFFSCEETINIDTITSETKVIIDGVITNNADLNFIKLSYTRGFYSKDPNPAIIDAVVTVTDDANNVVNYVHNPNNDPSKRGVYFPETPYAGSIWTTYHLKVTVDGVDYTASETLLPVTKIDSLVVTIDQEEMEDPEEEGRFYEILFYAREPQDRVDHYLFKFYRNGKTIRDFEGDIYFSEDDFLGEAISGVPTASYYKLGEYAKVEMYSITREAFIFYNDLSNLINSDGGMFSPPPANPRTNLSNGAFGYFQVSAVDIMEIEVKEPN